MSRRDARSGAVTGVHQGPHNHDRQTSRNRPQCRMKRYLSVSESAISLVPGYCVRAAQSRGWTQHSEPNPGVSATGRPARAEVAQ